MKSALKHSGLSTKKDVIEAGLKLLVKFKQQEKIKDSSFVKTSKDKSEDKQKSKINPSAGGQKSNIFNFLFVTLIFAFLFLNLIYSQIISPIYFRFINNDKNATINFLKKIKILPEYQNILEMNDNVYGNTVKGEILRQENKQKEMIKNLEQQLTINPKARDILYSLYRLYLVEGDKNRAADYLRRTKEVDPTIK